MLPSEIILALHYYIYIRKVTQDMVPNMDGTKLKKWKPCVIEYITNRNRVRSVQENAIAVFGTRLYHSLPIYLSDIRNVKTRIH